MSQNIMFTFTEPKPSLWTLFQIIGGLFIASLHAVVAVACRPSLLVNPAKLSELLFTLQWNNGNLGSTINTLLGPTKYSLINPHAFGVVLDVGSGQGQTIALLNRSLVSKVIALEPNHSMKPFIESASKSAGIPTEIVEDLLESLISSPLRVDTVVCSLTLCSVQDLETSVKAMINVLKPGGKLLVVEHIKSQNKMFAWIQSSINPVWSFIGGGCHLDRLSIDVIKGLGEWKEDYVVMTEKGGQLAPLALGVFVKK
ncbi:UNVERIFIED_CONTAM: hypothetical protein HDU68_001487 [Siphonaria sp. JEL0065]|nr:hypothetical protein HDU68_001487 [Siphonaria sp. JEL0065]